MPVVYMDHPLIKHKITMLRMDSTKTYEFRKIVEEIIAKGEKVDNPKISIPYITYEVNDLENFNKSEVKNYYKVDISDLI